MIRQRYKLNEEKIKFHLLQQDADDLVDGDQAKQFFIDTSNLAIQKSFDAGGQDKKMREINPDEIKFVSEIDRQVSLKQQRSSEKDDFKKLLKSFGKKDNTRKLEAKKKRLSLQTQTLGLIGMQNFQKLGTTGIINTDLKQNKTGILSKIKQEDDDQKQIQHQDLKQQWKIQLQNWTKLQSYLISPIAKRTFCNEMNTSRELCNDIFEEYKKFLLLTQLVKQQVKLFPSYYVKMAWDYHIVQTSSYRKFCNDIFGKYMHNDYVFSKAMDKQMIQRYEKTIEIYQLIFSDHNKTKHLWPQAERRFDFGYYYSFKMINIKEYLEGIARVKKRAQTIDQQHNNNNFTSIEEKIIMYEKKKGYAKMNFMFEPINGEEFILPKRTLDFQKEILQNPNSLADSFMTYDQNKLGSIFKEVQG